MMRNGLEQDQDETVLVCICTRGRPAKLERALGGLGDLDWPPGWSIVVVDNDAAMSAKPVVRAAAPTFPVSLRYVVVPTPGYSQVRNAAIEASEGAHALAFFDDDMIPGPLWIASLDADFRAHPESMIHTRVLRLESVPDDNAGLNRVLSRVDPRKVAPGGSGGLLLPLAVLGDNRFDPRFDKTGGEDTDLILRLRLQGVQSRYPLLALAAEEQRLAGVAMHEDARAAFRSGRLYAQILEKNGQRLSSRRVRALVGIPPAFVVWMISAARRQSAASRAPMRLVFRRLGMATSPPAKSYRSLAPKRTTEYGYRKPGSP